MNTQFSFINQLSPESLISKNGNDNGRKFCFDRSGCGKKLIPYPSTKSFKFYWR